MTSFGRALATAALLAAFVAKSALAEPFTLLIFESGPDIAKRTDTGESGSAYWGAYAKFAGEAGQAGILKGGAALYTDDNVLSVTAVGDKTAAGPAFDSDQPLRLGGYFQIDVTDREEAVRWAAKLPAATTGRIDIRAGYPAPTMK